ncbi:MAG: DGQHR domain-containing protein [Candidatus Stygibacter frigidus]|nr:DGQHR domain-containing protein [Candidatus Stygibacter frigidus]
MGFLKQYQIDEIKGKIVSDKSKLGKLFKAKKSQFQHLSIDHSLVADYIAKGWEIDGKPLKTKTRIKIKKSHSKQFEDDVWCQFYKLGYRALNYDENFILPFSKEENCNKQIDVIAINDDSIILVECKSSDNMKKAPSFKDEFELLRLRLDGFRKVLNQGFGGNRKIKYIFATRNLRINLNSEDLKRLMSVKAYYYNNNTYKYIDSLILKYKKAALFQFLGLVFKNEEISKTKIELPVVKGKMGKQDYYMFSIQPSLLLKMGFVLHRTKANESEFPTYQRLLVPSRLKGITKFIDDGGYFPNSIIVNFNLRKNKFVFEANTKNEFTDSCTGTLKIPNAYGIAYIIDGQHRVYGYANSAYLNNNTIPVVAFNGLDTIKQLEIFMDINQNQKAVSPSLRLDLEEDLFWNSERADSRLKALRSSIIKVLAYSESSPLLNKISVGEDRSMLSFKPFASGIANSDLLPSAKGNKYDDDSLLASLYDINNLDHNQEMRNAKKRVSELIISCYDFVETNYHDIFSKERYFITSNRGSFAFISLIGSLNKHETIRINLTKRSTNSERFDCISIYLTYLMDTLRVLPKDEAEKQLALLGSTADIKWLRFFQTIINTRFPEYNPPELIDWKERQDEELQNKGRKLGVEIEKFMKKTILSNLKLLFKSNWELEIGSIKRACLDRAEKEKERIYKEEGINSDDIPWTDQFSINDYKSIIEKFFNKRPEDYNQNSIADFQTFSDIFTIDIGEGIGSNAKRIKWISRFNSYRNLWAHEGTKEKRLNKEEVAFLQNIHSCFCN